MILKNISIRSGFFLLLVCSVLFWLIAGFTVLSLIDGLSRYQDSYRDVASLPQRVLRLENSVQSYFTNDLPSRSFHESGKSDAMNLFNTSYLESYSMIRELRHNTLFTGDNSLQQKLENLSSYLGEIESYMESVGQKSRERGWHDMGLSGRISRQMEDLDVTGSSLPVAEVQELLNELNLYLGSPRSDRLNSILILLNNLEEQLSNPSVGESSGLSMAVFLDNLRRLLQIDLEMGTSKYEGLQGRIFRTFNILYAETDRLTETFIIKRDTRIRQIRLGIILVILCSALIYGAALHFFSRFIRSRLKALWITAGELAAGRFPEGISWPGRNEFSEIYSRLNRFVDSIKGKAGFARELSEGKVSGKLEALSKDDSLAISLINLENSLQEARKEEEEHRRSRMERRWTNEGIAKFGDLLRIHSKDISSLAENIIQELVNYLNASAGGIFLVNSVKEKTELELIASFAFDRKKYLKKIFKVGEGLVGTCAIENEKIFLSEIPDEYINISSGLGESKPRCLLLVPLRLEKDTLGVIEIASLRVFEEYEVEFVEDLAGSIASAVSTVQMNMRTSQLLEQSQEQAREMAEQEEVTRQHVEELQATQEESARRESEISGILNAIHNSSLVAEFNMAEELLSINEKFQQLLQSHSSQLARKKYHEIIGVSKYTEEYKKFWHEIREGKTITRIDKVSLLTGQDIWLRQTFTPILDKDKNPFKVLNIAAEITETVKQRESLERQSNEITRANIEMKSFSDAVDKALIKCVYSHAGQILELNENYEQITGYTEKEMLGKNNRVFLQRVEKEQFDKIWIDIQKDKPYSGVIRRTRPTGEEVWLMSTFTPVKDENGNIFKVIFLGQDITERKLKYQLLEEANKEIERLRQQLGDRT